MAHPQKTPADVHAILAAAQDEIDRLRDIEPYLVDLSMRENPVGARVGQTLQDKLHILPKLRDSASANKRLYQAKLKGRNRIVSCSPPLENNAVRELGEVVE